MLDIGLGNAAKIFSGMSSIVTLNVLFFDQSHNPNTVTGGGLIK